MKITDTELKKFQTIFKKVYGCEITEKQAIENYKVLLDFIDIGLSFNKTKDDSK